MDTAVPPSHATPARPRRDRPLNVNPAQRLGLLQAIPVLAALSAVVFVSTSTEQTRDDNRLANLLGRQHAVVRQLPVPAEAYLRRGDTAARATLLEMVAMVDAYLRTLGEGGEVGGEPVSAAPRELSGELARLRRAWWDYRAAVQDLVEREPGSRRGGEALSYLRTHGARLAEAVARVRRALERHGASVRELTVSAVTLTAAVSAMCFLFGIVVLRAQRVERVRADHLASERAENLRALTDNAYDGILVHSQGRHVFANRSVGEMLGYGPDELIGTAIEDIVHAGYRARTRDYYSKRMRGELAPAQHESEFLRRDGGAVPVELTAARTTWHGQPALIVVSRDMSARKEAEAALRESEAHLRQIIDLVPNFIFAKDHEGRFLLVNKVVADYYGMSVDELTGRYHRDVHADSAEVKQMLADDREVSISGLPKVIPEESIVDAQGDRHVLRTVKIPYVVSGSARNAVLGVATDITEQKRVEEALREREILFRQLAENIQEVFFIRDLAQTRMVYVSPAYEKLWGRSLEAIYEDPTDFVNCVHPEDHERIVAAMRAQGEGQFFNEDYRIVRPGGSVRWIRARTFPVHNERGEVYRIAGLAEDITERREAMEALRASEERLRRSQEYANIGTWDWDIQTDELYWSEQTWSLFGYADQSRNVEDRFVAALHPEDRQRVLQAVHACVDRGADYDIEHRVVWPDGSVHWLHEAGDVVRGTDGKPLRMLGIAQDVTNRRLAEDALRESEARYRTIMENASDAIVLAAADGRLLDVNRRACELFGYKRDEFLEMAAKDLHPPEEWPKVEAAFRDMNDKGVSLYEHKIVHKDGAVGEAEVAGTMFAYGDSRVALGIFRDLTERRQAEHERLAHEKAQRDSLVREVHHRIKNHLQGLIGLLRQDAAANPKLMPLMQKVIGQIHSVAVVHGLQGTVGHGEVRLGDMIEAICRSAERYTGRRVALSQESDLVCPVCLRSEEAVSVALVLNELVTNAVKHGGDGAGPTVDLEAEAEKVWVTIRNPSAPLPGGFDFAGGEGLGTGLQLVRALLPREGAALGVRHADGVTEVRLILTAPVVVRFGTCSKQ